MPKREIHPPRWTLIGTEVVHERKHRKVERQNRCTKIHKHLSEPSICYKNIPSPNRYSKHTRSENQLQKNQDNSLKISAHILNCVISNRELCHQTHRARINAFAIANLQQNLFYEIAFNKREARARQRTCNIAQQHPRGTETIPHVPCIARRLYKGPHSLYSPFHDIEETLKAKHTQMHKPGEENSVPEHNYRTTVKEQAESSTNKPLDKKRKPCPKSYSSEYILVQPPNQHNRNPLKPRPRTKPARNHTKGATPSHKQAPRTAKFPTPPPRSTQTPN